MLRSLVRSAARNIRRYLIGDLPAQQLNTLLLLGKLHAERVRALPSHASIQKAEFTVFSQFGEDGILQYLLQRVPLATRFFVEFGVEDYQESNTRFLLVNDNWSGLVLDSDARLIEAIRRDPLHWRYDLTATRAFITRENIDEVLAAQVPSPDIGLLSIDLDGNDYWVWQAIVSIEPRIVVCEYNSLFGGTRAVTVPYDPSFSRGQAHFSHLYFGASLAALCRLGAEKGYDFVGCNSKGTNAFFVRSDLSAAFEKLRAAEGFVASTHRDSRDEQGNMNYLRGADRGRAIAHLQVLDVEQDRLVTLGEVIESPSRSSHE
ncbi:MAG: hypothetical protein JNK68_11910 [Betaproteobacteria bacterium]|nr:hypothetical protein [Betaproteobacteria bacterium]